MTAISDAAAKDKTRIKKMEDALLHSEYALCALSMKNETKKQDLENALGVLSTESQHLK